jgi:hypothetical protein
MGLNMKEKKAVTREYKPLYQKASKKEKNALLDEFTRLTGCHRKSAVRLLGARPIKQAVAYIDGKPVKVRPEKRRPSNRKGKRIYTDEVIDALRLVWTFFWFKCGKILAPLMRQQMAYIARWPAFGITGEIAEKLKEISPASIDRYLKKDKAAMRLKGKSLTKPMDSLKSRIPIRTFYTSEERKKPGFWQIDTVHHCGQATSGQYLHTLTATDISSGWIELHPLLNNAHKWTFRLWLTSKPQPFCPSGSSTAITAPNLSTTPRRHGVKLTVSPLPEAATTRKMTTALSNKKPARLSVSMPAMTALRG